MRFEKKIVPLFLLFVLLGLGACRGVNNVDPQTRLKERVEGFIQARQAGDQIAMQAFYLDPHQARTGNIRYIDSKIVAINFSDDEQKAEVQLKNDIKAMGFTFKGTPQATKWVWQQGDWYQVLNMDKNPFSRPANRLKKSTATDAKK